MPRYLLLAVMVSLLTAPFAKADPSCNDLNSLWSKKYSTDFKFDEKTEKFACPSPLSNLAGSLDTLFSADKDHAFYSTARKRVAETSMGKGCAKETIALMKKNGRLLVCESFNAQDAEKRAATLFHEVSHAREDDPGHVKCEQGDAENQMACDEEFSQGYADGSGYNWEVRYLWHRKHSQINDLSRWTADAHLRFLLYNRFNRITGEQLKKWGSK